MKTALRLGCLVLATGPALAACPLTPADGQLLAADGVQLAWRADPAEIKVGRPFSLNLKVCPADARPVRVDATMPEHRHGMNYRASLQALGDGSQGLWRAEGLLWHMSGRWALRIDVQNAGRTLSMGQSVTLP